MKRLFPIFVVIVSGLCLLGCSTGKVLSQRSLSANEQTWVAQQKIPIRLAIVPANSFSYTNQWEVRMVSNLATNLTRTKLFSEVVASDQFLGTDLLVMTRMSHGVLRCGTSLPITKASLGLVRDNIAYNYSYDFDFVSPRTGKTLTFTNLYRGDYRTGFWPAKDDAFVDLLKFDLAQKRAEIESLLK